MVYARGKRAESNGFVYKINQSALHAHGVVEYVVAQFCVPSVPDDDEVILVVKTGAHLPVALVVEVITVDILVT